MVNHVDQIKQEANEQHTEDVKRRTRSATSRKDAKRAGGGDAGHSRALQEINKHVDD
jgi:hypothetical protein